MRARSSARLAFAALGVCLAPTLARAADPEPSAAPPVAQPAPAAVEAIAPSAPAPADPDPTRTAAIRAYDQALSSLRLAATTPLSVQRLEADLRSIEEKLYSGRRDEAIGDLVYLVESPRFTPFQSSEPARAAVFLLGDALGRGGAYVLARGYLEKLLNGTLRDTWFRRACDSWIDLALASDRPRDFLAVLERAAPSAPEEVKSDAMYLQGRVAHLEGSAAEALLAYARVGERSRFWAQATYLSGVIEVERKQLKRGEELFCRVADPKRTPKKAALFGGTDFFRVRDLARLGLGRVAHEGYRFDDARYYYYLVPSDSERLPEALYETATTRYEAKDYRGAREAIDDLRRLKLEHVYQDEAWILDAYIDLAECRFPQADHKLQEFLKRYEPARNAARKIAQDPAATRRLVDAVRRATDPGGAGLGIPEETARALGALIRVDAGYGRVSLRLSQVEHQQRGLRGSMGELDEAKKKLAAQKAPEPAAQSGLGQRPFDKLARIESQLVELRRVLREAEQASAARKAETDALRHELETLELAARGIRAAAAPAGVTGDASGVDLISLIEQDRKRASALYEQAEARRLQVETQQLALAKDALLRLDKRLSRLVNRARLGRIETVLGRKRALEIEVEALSQGLLPQTIVDSLDAERFLGDNEEYWPFQGEEWADEYVGGEGLR